MKRASGERWYARLLRLYPREFRDQFGHEMTRLYRDRRQAEPAWRLWSSLMVDLLTTAPSEHVSVLRDDLRQGCRSWRRTPIITLTAVLTLALGIGTSTAMFSVVHGILLRPLPYPEPERIVELSEENQATGAQMRPSLLNYFSWTERAPTLDAIGAFRSTAATLTGNGDPQLVGGSLVTASLFRVLEIPPLLGRALREEDEQRGNPRVVLLGESLWRNRFGGDRQIIGRAITLDGERHEVVGVMPRTFREVGRSTVGLTGYSQLFLPVRVDRAQENRANHTFRVVGRLGRGVRIEQARDEMRAVAAGMAREFPDSNANWSARIEKVTTTMFEPQVRRSLLLLLAAVAMVFVIACANVANLLLVRGTRRGAELAVRTALGAGRSRLIRQLLTESSCLAVVSGLAGVVTAALAHPLMLTLLPPTLPRLDELHVDVGFLFYGLVLATLSGIGFGIVPAFSVSRFDPARSLIATGRTTSDATRGRLRQTLVVGQVALATVLLIAAALLVQGLVRLQHVPLGFDADHVVTARISLPATKYGEPAQTNQFYRQLLSALAGVAQVDAAAIGTSAPFGPGVRAGFQLAPRGQPPATGDKPDLSAAEHIVSDDYFRALGIAIVAGRSFTGQDVAGSSGVAIVSQRLARNVWPDGSAVGKTIERNGRIYDVIGVVGDVRGSDVQGLRGGGAEREPRAAVYFAASQEPQRSMTLVVRAPNAAIVSGAMREAIRAIDPALPPPPVRPLTAWVADSVESSRITTVLAAAFALCALLLTAVGIYGVLAYAVTTRTREIGVRMAVGATRARVVALVVRQGMLWAASGIVIGVIAAAAASRFLAALLFEVPARDPLTFAASVVAVAVAALLACSIPAARAVRIDPTIAMRMD